MHISDRPALNCTFDDGFCSWIMHDSKYVWYNVPFGLDHTVPHKSKSLLPVSIFNFLFLRFRNLIFLVEWGVLAAFAGKGNLWSPVVRSTNVRCFAFIYAKGEAVEAYLRVWLLVIIPYSSLVAKITFIS